MRNLISFAIALAVHAAGLYFLLNSDPAMPLAAPPSDAIDWEQVAQIQFTATDPIAAAREKAAAEQAAKERAAAEAARQKAAAEKQRQERAAREKRIAEQREKERRRQAEAEAQRKREQAAKAQAAKEEAAAERRRARAAEQAAAERAAAERAAAQAAADAAARAQAEANARAAAAAKASAQGGGGGGGGAKNSGGGQSMSAWKGGLQAAIERRKRYPRNARRAGKTGTVTVSFTVQANGGIGNVRVSSSSGNSDLDQAAVQAVQAVGSYTPPPNGQATPISVPITFRLR